MVKRVLIANRGEIACRIVRSCRELGLESVAVYSEVDVGARHVEAADHRVAIGPAAPALSYMNIDAILAAAARSGADAIHPGYGFLAEDHRFAEQVESNGLCWVGPTPKSIEDMGDKERARRLALRAGIPVLGGSARFTSGETAGALEAGDAVGYPLLIKAAAGGGGIGMRRIDGPDGLVAGIEATQAVAQRMFGDSSVYLERYVPEARHVEVQVFGFGDGTAVHIHERDCSVQRRFQKIIEESPAPGLGIDVRERMCEAALALCRQERYRGAGTVEFVVDAATHSFHFLEMNTRIQVEHPVSEAISGLDLVGMQLRLAAGLSIATRRQSDIVPRGHAIECRLYAERPGKGFLPSTGTLDVFRFPEADASLRIDSGYRHADQVTHHYDPMIAKIITSGVDRDEAIERMRGALADIDVSGVETNLGFLRRAIDHPAFRTGGVTTGFVDRFRSDLLGHRIPK